MDAIVAPLERVHEALSWFLAATEQRVLYLQTAAVLRLPILERLAAAEGQKRCPSPVLVLEAGVDECDDGWATRVEELANGLAAARKRAAAADPPLSIAAADLPPPVAPVAWFAQTLRVALGCVQAPLRGLIVVLAPAWVNAPASWVDALRALLPRPELAAARWVVVDPEDGPARSVAEALGPLAEVCDARIDAAAAARSTAAMVAGMTSAPAGSGAARAAGLAGPREAPPRRVGESAVSGEERARALTEPGLAPGLARPDLMQRLRIAVMGAAQSVQAGDAIAAIRRQREARDLAVEAGLVRESLVLEIALGTYVLQAGAAERALEVFDAAARRAEAAAMPELAAQAELAKGSTLAAAGRRPEAALAYADAGRLAETVAPVLAIEAWRMAGTLLVELRQEPQAVAIWRRAIELAEAGPQEVRAGSTAPDVARSLAAVCRRRGLKAQAESLEHQAEAMAQPPKAGARSPEGVA